MASRLVPSVEEGVARLETTVRYSKGWFIGGSLWFYGEGAGGAGGYGAGRVGDVSGVGGASSIDGAGGTAAYFPSTEQVGTTAGLRETPQQAAPKNTHFFMTAQLDNTRIGRDVSKLVEEVISHLAAEDGVQVEVTLEVSAASARGMSQQTVRTVSENCRTLRVRDFGFEE
jgi:hypothetical protein